MVNEKKCQSCGKWSEWNKNLTDACTFCGSILSPEELANHQQQEALKEKREKEWMFYISPDDSTKERILKKYGKVAYLIMMAIGTFLMWVAAWVVH